MNNLLGPLEQEAADAAKAEWIGTPPEDDWYRLTLMEQHRYVTELCDRLGVVYRVRVERNRITLVAEIPERLSLSPLGEQEKKRHESYLRSKFAEALTWVFRFRDSIGNGRN